MSSVPLWCNHQGKPRTPQCRANFAEVSWEQEAMQPLRGSVVPVLGPRSVGAACIFHTWLQYVQSSVNNLTDNMISIISAEGQRVLFPCRHPDSVSYLSHHLWVQRRRGLLADVLTDPHISSVTFCPTADAESLATWGRAEVPRDSGLIRNFQSPLLPCACAALRQKWWLWYVALAGWKRNQRSANATAAL